MKQKKRYLLYVGALLVVVVVIAMTVVIENYVPASARNIVELNDNYISKGNSKIYYTENISRQDVEGLIAFLDFDNYFNTHVYMKVDKSSTDDYYVFFVVSNYVFNSEPQLRFYQATADEISINVFNSNKVTVYLCNNNFEPIKIITSKILKESER